MRRVPHLALWLSIALLPCAAAAQQPAEQVFVVKDYRYQPASKADDADLGQSLCGTRCNALSIDYQNYMMPGGWRMVLVAAQREVPVSLDNPFMGGTCICVVEEYCVFPEDRFRSNPLPSSR